MRDDSLTPISLSSGARVNWSVSGDNNWAVSSSQYCVSRPDRRSNCQRLLSFSTVKLFSLTLSCGALRTVGCRTRLSFSSSFHCCQALICPASDQAVARGCSTRTVSHSWPAVSGIGQFGRVITWRPCGAISRTICPAASRLPSWAIDQCRTSLSLRRNRYSLVTSIWRSAPGSNVNWKNCCSCLASYNAGCGVRSANTSPFMQN